MNIAELKQEESACREGIKRLVPQAKSEAQALIRARRNGSESEIEEAASKYELTRATLAERLGFYKQHAAALIDQLTGDMKLAVRHELKAEAADLRHDLRCTTQARDNVLFSARTVCADSNNTAE